MKFLVLHSLANFLMETYFSRSAADLGFNPDGSAVNPSAFQQQIRNDSNVMAQLFQVRVVKLPASMNAFLPSKFFLFQESVQLSHNLSNPSYVNVFNYQHLLSSTWCKKKIKTNIIN